MKIILEIKEEDSISMTAESLYNDYKILNDSILEYYNKYSGWDDNLIPVNMTENLYEDIKYRDAIEIALKYYMTDEEYNKKVLEID